MRLISTKVALTDCAGWVVLAADLPGVDGLSPVWVGEGPEETMTADPDRAGAIDGRHSFATREEAIEAVNVAGYFVKGDRVMRAGI